MTDEFLAKIAAVKPSPRQLEFQKTEFYAFVHFTVNTYTDREWGDGTESPEIFDPTDFDPEQWCKAIKKAGMRGLILTCKHHDGFCLWPSKYTDHTVAASPYKQGGGDIVKETAAACEKHGLKFGIYFSPWDRHEKTYGRGKAYDDFFVSQLTELLTGYGNIFCVWFDGACGEGPNGKRQYYDWERYYETVRKYRPDACINVCGPDIRWCGNEAGHTRPSEWSVLPKRMRDTEKIASLSQQNDDESFRQRKLSASDLDLGSREKLEGEEELIWYPAEVNTSIRPGWFYHKSENDKVKTPEELLDIYCNSVGGNATLLLNIPPMPNGLLNPNDVICLYKLGSLINELFEDDVTEKTEFADHITRITLKPHSRFATVVLQENIANGQLVEAFELYADGDKVYEGTVIGYKKIIRLEKSVSAKEVYIKITQSRAKPEIITAKAYADHNKEFDNIYNLKPKGVPTLDEVRAAKEVHGKLIGFSMSSHSSGMAFNSDSTSSTSISLNSDGDNIVTSVFKMPYSKRLTNVYKADHDVLAELSALAERENLAAWSKLKYVEFFKAADCSSSSSISLTYDDSALGGGSCTYINIDVYAADQQGGEDVIKEIEDILSMSSSGAELLSTSEEDTFKGMMNQYMSMTQSSAQIGWVCKKCNATGNTGKFCPECGTPREG